MLCFRTPFFSSVSSTATQRVPGHQLSPAPAAVSQHQIATAEGPDQPNFANLLSRSSLTEITQDRRARRRGNIADTARSFCLLGIYLQARLDYPARPESAPEVPQINAQIVEVQKHSLKLLKMLNSCLKLSRIPISPYCACVLFPLPCAIPLFHADHHTDCFT